MWGSTSNRQVTKKFVLVVLETREAYLVKRRSFPDSDASRFTNDEDGLLRRSMR